jgi:hypothetical protein
MAEEPQKTEKSPVLSGDNRDEKGKFLPGQSGNPDGRPEGTLSLTSMLRKALEEIVDNDFGEKKMKAQIMIDLIVSKVIKDKDVATAWNIVNRIEGFPKQAVSLGSEEGVKVIFEDANPNADKKSKTDKSIQEESPGVSG